MTTEDYYHPPDDSNLPVTQNDVADLPALTESEPIGTVRLTREEREVLYRPAEMDRVMIKPSGEVYLPMEFYRSRMAEAIGAGRYAEKIRKVWKGPGEVDPKTGEVKSEILYVMTDFYIDGVFVTSAVGSHSYYLSNRRMDYSDSFESAMSNSFVRCAKHIGIGLEAWRANFRNDFVREHCIKVVVNADGKMQVRWRRKDSPPFEGELQQKEQEDVTTKATPEQVTRLEELTEHLDPADVVAALQQRQAATFADLTELQARHIITTLTKNVA